MSKKVNKVPNDKQILTSKGIGFEWNVAPNYFNKNNYESDESETVRHIIVKCYFVFFKLK